MLKELALLPPASQTDAATSWAGYVAGCLLVLAREEDLSLSALLGGDSVAIIVSSEVPEGKGVSSSAAVEVAVMMAMVEAFSMQVGEPRGKCISAQAGGGTL